jgi:hypothetical protein
MMYGVQLVILLKGINIMLVLLMISASSYGSTFLSTNLKSFKNSKNYRALLNGCLTRKFLPFKPTGMVNIKNYIPSLRRLVSLITSHVLIVTSRVSKILIKVISN